MTASFVNKNETSFTRSVYVKCEVSMPNEKCLCNVQVWTRKVKVYAEFSQF